jgi:hypothetical protein
MTKEEITAIIEENSKRNAVLHSYYNPVTGEGSPLERKLVVFTAQGNKLWYYIPASMYDENEKLFDVLNRQGSVEKFLRKLDLPVTPQSIEGFIKGISNIRERYDFEFWGFTNAKIQDKKSKQIIPFKLNFPQRKYLAELEKMRLADEPIRAIIDKARQWGGSTMTEIYMAWIQIVHKTGWHSVVIADVENQARNIRGMYTRLAKNYPEEAGGEIVLVPYEGSTNCRMIRERECIIGVGSAQKPENLRSYDIAMAHLSEVGSFKATLGKTPEDLVQNIRGSIPDVPYSLEILESTAKGVGNFFHREWTAAIEGRSGYVPVFIPWYEIEMYQKPIGNLHEFITWMKADAYASYLWNLGATLEGIKWYTDFKRRKNYDDWRMMSEFPSTWEESFQYTGARVFSPQYVQNARKNCIEPEFRGDIFADSSKGRGAFRNVEFRQTPNGDLYIWGLPDKTENITNRYAVVVDIGGRTRKADWSVIKVIDRYWMKDGGKPEVVAVWAGHLDQDLVSWKAAQIASFYNNALLVIEFNSLDKEEIEGSEGDHSLTVLDEIVRFYRNIYARSDPEKVRHGLPVRYGFFTDRSTKPMVIDELNGALREGAYIERDRRACDEMDTYEVKPNGRYGAAEGCHDDHVMATAIGVWICFKYMPTPKVATGSESVINRTIVSEASL